MSEDRNSAIVKPGQWLGMIGGGQLGRMFCHAAQRLGYRVAVLDPDAGSPAGAVADHHLCASYDSETALVELAQRCPAVTTEFENVPADSLRFIRAQGSRVSPSGDAVAIVQNRIEEKAFIQKAGVEVAPYAAVRSEDDLQNAPESLFPGILKVARLGYDGKGQARVASRVEAYEAFVAFDKVDCVLEALMPLEREISVVMARGYHDDCVFYAPAVNVHHHGILAVSSASDQADEQGLSRTLLAQARDAAAGIAKSLDYRGVLCVEFFVLEGGSLLANEVAPRPHNSGHHTIDACISSQFEQQVRVMTGMPLGNPQAHSASIMLNLLGDLWFNAQGQYEEPDWPAVLAIPGAHLHLYGKSEARVGRKMGHVTVVAQTLAQAKPQADEVVRCLKLPY
ncbi:MAG: 5-(carboxyamino)imidazole ribonucleotide synthase [Pusillimonas sp.]|jgi:5-(carboxyamino)imidazole ribonucleotide synthase|nr:5-(carboxyamino)imidazole ribonucleotide synthase [Pusillimonas sp.]MBC42432.1 5-(carboxyamino)imidazole ribonucleotide synthase [Pusillimonas sp.]|tara:strand:+ start:121873 stop:123060 length:1188 start_codon:yes stop_codon:yes gene_type:complete